MFKPKPLKRGSRVALVAPSSPTDNAKVNLAMKSLDFLGLFPIKYHSCNMKNGYLSGPDIIRAKDINNSFKDSSIDGVFCLRGGYGATRILPMLDYRNIKKNPKIFLGYSDVTALHIVINKFCGFSTVHAPMPTIGYHTMDRFSLESLSNTIFSNKPIGVAPTPDKHLTKTLYPGIAEGIIVGGNLSVIAATLGSKYEIDTKNKILFIEDVGERPYKIDRCLTALSLAGKFKECSGIILGTFADCTETKLSKEDTLTLTQIFRQTICPFKKPTISNFHAGHTYPQISIPMGVRTRIDAFNGTVEFLE